MDSIVDINNLKPGNTVHLYESLRLEVELFRNLNHSTPSPDSSKEYVKTEPRLWVKMAPWGTGAAGKPWNKKVFTNITDRYAYLNERGCFCKGTYAGNTYTWENQTNSQQQDYYGIPDYELFLNVNFSALKYNNPYMFESQFMKVIKGFLKWAGKNFNNAIVVDAVGNNKIMAMANDFYKFGDPLPILKSKIKELKEYNYPIDMREHWYCERIEILKGSEKFKEKSRVRNKAIGTAIRQDLEQATFEYRSQNWMAYPTVKYLSVHSGYSEPTIRKHGKALTVGKKINTVQQIYGVFQSHGVNTFTQMEIADALAIDIRTVNRYWKDALKKIDD